MTQTAVLVGFTPTHLIPMLEIVRGLDRELWLFHPEAEKIPMHLRRGLNFLGRCDDPHRSRSLKYTAAGISLRTILCRGAEALVCVPHPFNPLSNFAFFAPGTAEVRLYQDGVLNYYDASSPLGDRRVLFRRRLKAAAALLPYRAYSGHLSGTDARPISVGYFTHPELAVQPESFGRMSKLAFDTAISSQPPSTDEACVLFLDQPIERLMPQADAKTIREQAYAYADSLGAKVLYKPHYTQHSATVPKLGWQQVSAEESALPAEELPAIRKVAAVVSFCSSALANIHLARPHVRCVAFGASKVPIRISGCVRTMADLLDSLGVQTIDPPMVR